jgi:hypothetical protein
MLTKGKGRVLVKKCDSCAQEIKSGINVLTFKSLSDQTLVWDYCDTCIKKLIEYIGQPSRTWSD